MATSPEVDQGLLAQQMPAAPTVTGTSYAPSTMTPTTTTGQGYTAAQADVADWNVDSNQTVQGQVQGIIAANSPLMQQAQTRARQQAAGLGLLNSSMAVGAGQSALYDAALPMAQADAATYANAARTNAGERNTTNRFNTGALNQASEFTAGAANTANLANMDAQNQAAQFNTAQQNAAAQFEADTGFRSQLANQDAGVKTALTQYDGQLKAMLANADAATRVQLQEMDGAIRTNLANIEAKYQKEMQASQSMAQSYQAMIDSITRIMTDQKLKADGKQAAIDQITQMYSDTLQLQQDIGGLELGSLLAPSEFIPGAAPAPAPAAAAPAPATNYNGSPVIDWTNLPGMGEA